MTQILVVDDQKAQRKNLAFYLKSQGYEVDTAESGEEALARLQSTCYDLVISDFKMEMLSGLELLKQGHRIRPSAEFIIVSGFGTIPLAVDTIKEGAADFIPKPFEYAAILDAIHKIQRKRHSVPVGVTDEIQIVAQSEKMKEIFALTSKAAASDVSILIEGESGTGKEMFARLVHDQSRRNRNLFQVVDCSGQEKLLEQEIFGSGDNTSGALSLADGGTVLLSDIDCLSLRLQSRVARYLREGSFSPVDSAVTVKSNARIVAATSKKLRQQMQSGEFRDDLYYLLSVMPVIMPPLRARKDDIEPLVRHFLNKYANKTQKEIKGVAPEVISWMMSYDWPGNIQEMENIIARACALASNEILDESLFFALPQDRPEENEDAAFANLTLKDNQRTLILKALRHNNGNYSRTATQLGISRTTLWRRMKRFRIEGLPVESC